MKNLLIAISLLFIMSFVNLSAQELDASVVINYDQLETVSKDRLINFARAMEDYLNGNRFTREEWEGEPIKCTFNVFFTGASETKYRAQVVITSQRPIYKTTQNSLMMRVQDQMWSFDYENGQSMYFNQTNFDPLTSFLDFYAYIIIGLDMDSFYQLGGTDYFSKALDIAVLGSSTQYKDGWISSSSAYNRRGLVDDLLNAKYQQFRQDYFDYHYNGLDLQTEGRKIAQDAVVKLIKDLEQNKSKIDSRSVLMKVFFEAKSGEICDILKDYSDISIFETLKRIDPQHTSKYNEVLDAREG